MGGRRARTPPVPGSGSAPLLGDLFDEPARLRLVAGAGNIRLRDDADEAAVLLDDRQAPHLVLRHQPERLVQILLRIHDHEARRGDLLHLRRLRVLAFGDDADGDVTVGDRADEAIALDDRGETDVLVAHHLRRVGDGLVRVDRTRIRGHELTNGFRHRCSSRFMPLNHYGYPTAEPPKRENERMKSEVLADRIRDLALSFPEAYEDHPWGDFPVFKVPDNKVFGFLGIEPKEVSLTVKVTAEERDVALLLPFVSIAR